VTQRADHGHRPLGAVGVRNKPYTALYPSSRYGAPERVEKSLGGRLWTVLSEHQDQGVEGACVGASLSWARSIMGRPGGRFDWGWLYTRAKFIDPWPGEDYEGTSVDAGCRVLRTRGHKLLHVGHEAQPARRWGHLHEPDLRYAIGEYRWAASADRAQDIRAHIAGDRPTVLGIPWFRSFDQPVLRENRYGDQEWWIGLDDDLGDLRGYHAICGRRWTDESNALRTPALGMFNTWGLEYPPVLMPADVVNYVTDPNNYGEAALLRLPPAVEAGPALTDTDLA